MANEQNLKPFTSDQDREQAKINGTKGGKARQRQIKQQKTTANRKNFTIGIDNI